MPERPTWYWDAAVARFRDQRGRFVAAQTVRDAVEASLEASQQRAASLGWLVANKRISPNEFREEMRALLKEEHIRQALVGNGGLRNMTPQGWGSVGGRLSYQYSRLDGFVTDLVTKELTEAQIVARARMYGNSARPEFERARWEATRQSELGEVRWVLGEAEHCPDCLELAGLGWQNIADDPFDGAVPGDGTTVCKTNCHCRLEYRLKELRLADPGTFASTRDMMLNPKYRCMVTPYPPEYYAEHGGKCYLSPSGRSGCVVMPDGDIISVFSGSGAHEGGQAMTHAIRHGGVKLDCYDGRLPGIYGRLGFEEYDRWPWDDQYAPDDWDYERFGRPDVVLMKLKGVELHD